VTEETKIAEEHWPQSVALNIYDRVLLWGILPKEGSIATLKSLQAIKERVANSDEENKEYEFVSDAGRTSFNLTKAKESPATDFSFSRAEWKLVEDALRKLEVAKKLPLDCLAMYERFTEKQTGE
jgi:hypothetical protein